MANILGISDSTLRTIPKESTIRGVLQDFGNDLQKSLRENLDTKVLEGQSNNLRQSIVFDIQFLGQAWQFELKMDDYGSFIDEGVGGVGGDGYVRHQTSGRFNFKPGNKPSARHFSLFSQILGVSPFAIRESVFRKGLKPNHFYSDVVNDDLIDKLTKDLEKAGAKSLAISIALESDKHPRIKGTAQ